MAEEKPIEERNHDESQEHVHYHHHHDGEHHHHHHDGEHHHHHHDDGSVDKRFAGKHMRRKLMKYSVLIITIAIAIAVVAYALWLKAEA